MWEQLAITKRCLVVLLLLTVGIALAGVFSPRSASGGESHDGIIAQGGGTTIVLGGTGSGGVGPYPPFTPVLTTLAFHAEKDRGTVTGALDCLARAPESGAVNSSQSAQFTVNVMYVTGQVNGATVEGATATLTGTADVTGLGAGSNVPFTFVVRRGGPGATAVLTVSGLTFNEVLLEGAFQLR